MSQLNLLVVTPEKTLLECVANSVIVPLFDGSKGILPGHAPMIGRMGPGVLKVAQAGQESKYFVEGGFVQVDKNVVSVLTNVAIPLNKLNSSELESQLSVIKTESPSTAAEKLSHQRRLIQTKAMLQAANAN